MLAWIIVYTLNI